jgi:pimeloyl-ACP methyl ester carboxylesterase
MWPQLEAVAPTLAYDAKIMEANRWDLPARLTSIRVPTLMMAGGASPAPMQNAARSAAQAIPGAEFRLLEGQTHEVSAEALAPEVISFFIGETGRM